MRAPLVLRGKPNEAIYGKQAIYCILSTVIMVNRVSITLDTFDGMVTGTVVVWLRASMAGFHGRLSLPHYFRHDGTFDLAW